MHVESSKIPGPVNLAGVIISKTERVSQKGNKYAFLQLSDHSGSYEIIIFSELLAATNEMLRPGNTIYIKATALFEGETARITAQSIQQLEYSNSNARTTLKVFVDEQTSLPSLRKVLSTERNGQGEIILVSRVNQIIEVEVLLPEKYNVSDMLAKAVKAIPGVIQVL